VSDLFKAVAALCAMVVAILGVVTAVNGVNVASPQQDTGGNGTEISRPADACIEGYVWREAFSGDHVCVTRAERTRVHADDEAAESRIDPNGAYGSDSCVQGYVWRGARPEDHVCVTSKERDRVAADNEAAAERVATP
jgi:hypothetical protein